MITLGHMRVMKRFARATPTFALIFLLFSMTKWISSCKDKLSDTGVITGISIARTCLHKPLQEEIPRQMFSVATYIIYIIVLLLTYREVVGIWQFCEATVRIALWKTSPPQREQVEVIRTGETIRVKPRGRKLSAIRTRK